jgi:endonuclease/exonuclease/phosphatase family metal-dependent hydrolase
MDATERRGSELNAGPTLRVLSYNVRHGQGVASLPSNRRLSAVISAIAPDVAALSEVRRIGTVFDQPARIHDLTKMDSAYQAADTKITGDIGNLILTSGVIHSTQQIALGGKRERRGCIVAEVEVAGMRFRFAATHLSLNAPVRQQQLERLAAELPTDTPLVLAGDLNCGFADLGPLSQALTFSENSPATYPSVYPMRALDHIGFSAHWELVSLAALPSLASDHRPLVAELRLIGGTGR